MIDFAPSTYSQNVFMRSLSL